MVAARKKTEKKEQITCLEDYAIKFLLISFLKRRHQYKYSPAYLSTKAISKERFVTFVKKELLKSGDKEWNEYIFKRNYLILIESNLEQLSRQGDIQKTFSYGRYVYQYLGD